MSTYIGGSRGDYDRSAKPTPDTVFIDNARDHYRAHGHVIGDQCVAVYTDRDEWHPYYYRCDLPAKGALESPTIVVGNRLSEWRTVRLPDIPVCGKHGRARYVSIERSRVPA